MSTSPKARVSTAAPRRSPARTSSPASPSTDACPREPVQAIRSGQTSRSSSVVGLHDQLGGLQLTVEQLDTIKELFDVHDFVCAERRKGRTLSGMTARAPGEDPTAATGRVSPSHAELLDEQQRYGVALKPLRRTPSAELRLLHDTLFSTTAVAEEERVAPGRFWKDTLDDNDARDHARLIREQQLVQAEIVRLREWRHQQRMLFEESLDAQSTAARAAPSAAATSTAAADPPPRTFPDVVPPTAGVTLHYFANVIVGPFLESFFPSPTVAGRWDPSSGAGPDGASRRPSVQRMSVCPPPPAAPRTSLAADLVDALDRQPEIQQLFRVMDTNADQRVSWDEFCQYVLETGQRRLLGRDSQQSGRGSPAPAGEPGDTASAASLQNALGFTRVPTNQSVWQSQFPLVRYLFHKVPLTKLLLSRNFPRFITAGNDGLVKLWRTEPGLHDDTNRAVIIHERNLLSLSAPITDIALSSPSMGDAEVVAATAMDGTVTLLRVATGELVRTFQGVRTSNAAEVAVMGEAVKSRLGVDHETRDFEAQDLLSLRTRQPGVSTTVLRQPYTVDAYHDEAVEIFFGQASRYFRGLEVMAPTYEHLKRPVSLTADVLFSFGAEPSATDKWLSTHASARRRAAPPRASSRSHSTHRGRPGGEIGDDDMGEDADAERHDPSFNWFATAVGLTTACGSGGGHQLLPRGAYLLVGFENGVLQAYALNQGWFQLAHMSAARVAPPSGRRPAFSAQAHTGAITHMVVSEAADALFTAGADGAIEVRSLSRLEAPMLRLGDGPTVGPTAPTLTPTPSMAAGGAGHVKRVTCMAWDDTHHILVTGGMDYKVLFWSSRSPRPLFGVDLREQQRSVSELSSLGACGYPLDVSFMQHGNEPLRAIVLDSKRVIRFLNAMNGQLMGFLVDHSPESAALGEMLVARYEPANSRLILGGRCLRVWNTVKEGEYAEDYAGHRKPVLFMDWHHGLQSMVTADEEHVVMWRISVGVNELALERQSRRRAAHTICCETLRERAQRERLITRVTSPGGSADSANDKDDDDDAAANRDEQERSSLSRTSPGVDHPVLFDEVYDGLSPTVRTDNAVRNHTYVQCQTRAVRSFRVEDGIRSVALDPHSLTAALFVALLRTNAVVQLNVFNGAPLRRFAFAARAHDIHGLFSGTARMTATEKRPSPLLCAAYEEAADMGVTSLYHVSPDDDVQRHGANTVPSTHTDTAGTDAAEVGGLVAPYRQILSRGSLVTSVLVLSAMNVVVMGGRGQLFMTPVADATAFAIPFRTLVDQATIEETELRRSLQVASQHRHLGVRGSPSSTTSSAAAHAAVTNPRTRTALLTLTALFPGRLVPDPVVEETRMSLQYRQQEERRRRSRLSVGTGASVGGGGYAPSLTNDGFTEVAGVQRRESGTSSTAFSFPQPGPAAGSDGQGGAKKDQNGDELDALLAKELQQETQQPHGGGGYIEQLCALGATGYVVSATHEGVLQLWNVRTSSEVMRFRVTLTACRVTALSTNVEDHCTSLSAPVDPVLVAVGDEMGYVVLLDLSELPWGAAQPLDMLPDVERHVIVVDRWRAHRQDVRSVRFLPTSLAERAEGRSAQSRAAPRCPRTATLNAFVASSVGTQRSNRCSSADTASADEEDSLYSPYLPDHVTRETPVGLPKSLSCPVVLASASEDTYTYVWRWQSGLLNCLGCFGMGPLTVVSPPLSEPSYRAARVFETARRVYVLRRLVQECGFFRRFAGAIAHAQGASSVVPSMIVAGTNVAASVASVASEAVATSAHNTPRGREPAPPMRDTAAAATTEASALLTEDELEEALLFMEGEVHALLCHDPAAVLSTWGSLSDVDAQSAAEEAANQHSRLVVMATTLGDRASRQTPPGSARSSPLADPLMKTPPPAPPTLFDYAGLDGAYGWMDAVAAAAARDPSSVASFQAPPLETTLPWLRSPPSSSPAALQRVPFADTLGPTIFTGISRDLTETSAFVVAFMRGCCADASARACLRRTVVALRSTLTKLVRRQPHTSAPLSETRGPAFAASVPDGLSPPATVAETTTRPNTRAVTGDAPLTDSRGPPTPHTTASGTGSDDHQAHAERGDVPSAMSPTRVFFRRGSAKSTSSKAASTPTQQAKTPASVVHTPPAVADTPHDADDAVEPVGARTGRFRIRGPRGEPVYRVGYSAPSPVVRTALGGDAAQDGDDDIARVTRLSEGQTTGRTREGHRAAPPLLSAHYRRVAATATTDGLATTARDPFEGRGVRLVGGGGGAAGDVIEDEEALATEDAAFVIHNAHLNHRRAEAVSQLLEAQAASTPPPPLSHPHSDTRQRKTAAASAAVESGQVGLATLDELAATATATALFGREQLLFDTPVAHKPLLSSRLREGLPLRNDASSRGGEEPEADWYTKRDRLRRERQQEQALWSPSRIMLTLMDWEATLSPEERRAQASAAEQPPTPVREDTTTATSPLSLPAFLPTSLQPPPARPPADVVADAQVEDGRPTTAHLAGSAPPTEAAPATTTFSGATRDMQQNTMQTRNLNAVVAREVQHLRQIMRESLEAREAAARESTGCNLLDATGPLGAGATGGGSRAGGTPSKAGSQSDSPFLQSVQRRLSASSSYASSTHGTLDENDMVTTADWSQVRLSTTRAPVSAVGTGRKRTSALGGGTGRGNGVGGWRNASSRAKHPQ